MEGGIGAYSAILAQTLSEQGHQVFVFTNAAANTTPSSDIHITANVTHWSLMTLWQIKAWATEHELDIVSLQFQTAAYGMSPYIHFLPNILRSIPVITTFHDLRFPYLFPKAGKLRTWIVNHLAKVSSGVIVTNHEDANALKNLEKIKLIPIGSNILQSIPANFDPAPLRSSINAENAFLLAYFGLINHSKGMETLLEGLAQLRTEEINAKLVIIGGTVGASDPTNNAYLTQIDAQIEKLGLKNHVHRTGYVDDQSVGIWLTAADAVALPFRDGASYRRGSLMAAIQYACPIITSAPNTEIPAFKHRENMLLHPIDDVSTFVDAAKELYATPQLRQKLKQGAQLLAHNFDWEEIAREHVTFFTPFTKERA